MPVGMSKEETMKMLVKQAEDLKSAAEEYDIPLSEILGATGEEYEMGEESEEEEMDGPDIEKAAAMMKALRTE